MAFGLHDWLLRQRRKAGRGVDGRFLIFIVGARENMEGELCRHGLLDEAFARLCPVPSGFEFVLIGPEMETWERTCGTGATSVARSFRGLLHDWVESNHETPPPNAAVCFHSGLGTLQSDIADSWLPSFAWLLSLDVPLLLTCFNANESAGEAKALGALGARIVIAPRRNPFAHVTPLEMLAETPKERSRAVQRAAAATAAGALGSEVAHLYLQMLCGSTLDAVQMKTHGLPRARCMIVTPDEPTQLLIDAYEEFRSTGSPAAAERLRALMDEHLPGSFVEGLALA